MFLFRGVESHPRSLVKAITWRMLGSLDTFILGLIFTGGNAKTAGAIAGTEIFTKIFLFYFHERGWALVHWGHLPAGTPPDAAVDGSAPQKTAPETPA